MAKIRNIGKVSQQWLYEIDIHNFEDLCKCGSVMAYGMIRAHHPKVTLNLLWSLEGAILDIDWREISEAQKATLRNQLR